MTETPQEPSPLPIHPDETNLHRIDPEEPITMTGVYRHSWERRPPPEWAGDDRSVDVYDSLNYLTKNSQYEARARWRTKHERY